MRCIFPVTVLLALLPGSLVGCAMRPLVPESVTVVLEQAGDNRGELRKALDYFEQEGDSLKFAAVCYLIANMLEHSYLTYYVRDSLGNEIPFNVMDYSDAAALAASIESLEKQHGELSFERCDPIYDIHTITAGFLIEQIDFSFRAWREKPWAQSLSWKDFRDYVLPYRGSNEPLESWRTTFWEKYQNLESRLKDRTDPIEAAAVINRDIMSWFRFDSRFYFHPTDQGMAEMLQTGLGRCEDMTNVTIYAMRANGIGVTSDYTPHWPNASNNHAWNVIVTPTGKVVPFMGAQANPAEYRLDNKFAKVYRKTFDAQPGNLVFQEKKQAEIPRWLSSRHYRDVTADYTDPCDVAVVFDRDIPDSVDIAYLSVFNSGEWKAIHWARVEDNRAVFTDMGKNIVYLPALYLGEEIVPYSKPFILRDDCSQNELHPRKNKPGPIRLISTTKQKKEAGSNSRSFLTAGKEYELFYWDYGWQSLGKKIAQNKPLQFDNAPADGLYWLVAADSAHDERIFTVEHDVQVWW